MKNFDRTRFSRKIAVQAPVQVLYDAWTKASEIKKWFLREARYVHENGSPVKPDESIQTGDRYAWRWYLYEGTEEGRMTTADGKNYLQFTFAGECLVDIELTEENGYTVVTLTQSNIPLDEDSQRDIRLGCHTGWSFYLVNLKSVYEGGLDLRGKDTRFKPMVNN